MKKNLRFFVTLVLLFPMFSFITMADDLNNTPVVISPGSELGVAIVDQICPTFSWSSVSWAKAYRVAIFEVQPDDGVLYYEDVMALTDPVMVKDIKGSALSWTPSLEEAFRNGGEYVWFVQAVDVNGNGSWSTGNKFRVEASPVLPGLINNLKKRFKEFGVEEGVVDEVFKGLESGEKEGVTSEESTEAVGSGNTISRTLGSEGDAHNNVYYGNLAGVSLDMSASGGFDNTFFGFAAGYATSTGDQNTFIGSMAGDSHTTGGDNTFVGYEAGGSNTTGSWNTFIGKFAGYSNTSGGQNTFIGLNAGYSNTTTDSNTFIGTAAGYSNTSGSSNTFIGDNAGDSNTTGSSNTFIGKSAGGNNNTGQQNTFFGMGAGASNQTGHYNTFLGSQAGYFNTAGLSNVFLGYRAGHFETGSNKLYIDSSETSSPLIYGEFDNNLVKINGNFWTTGYFKLGSTQINSISTGTANNDKLVTQGYVDENDDVGGGLTGDYMANNYLCKWDDGNSRLINSLITDNGGNIGINGTLSLNNNTFSLDNGSNWISSAEINILDGKTLVTSGSVDNDKLVTKGYVDASDDVGGGLTGAFMTDQKICKWDDGNTRLVDSLISESPGIVSINGNVGIGTQTPTWPIEVSTTGTNAGIMLDRTDGANFKLNVTSLLGQFGTRSNHKLNIVTNNSAKMTVDINGYIGISDTTPDYPLDMGTIGNNAHCTTGGVWQNGSSRASKENIRDLTADEAMSALKELNPVRFNYKVEKTEDYVGFIAEDVPELVATNDRKTLGAMDIIAVLTKVLKEQQKSIREQQKNISQLQKRIAELENR